MKTLGIIGGIGPESTIEYYRRINALYRERIRDGSAPSIIINSIDLKKLLSNADPNDVSRNLDLTPLLRRFLLRCYIIFREEN